MYFKDIQHSLLFQAHFQDDRGIVKPSPSSFTHSHFVQSAEPSRVAVRQPSPQRTSPAVISKCTDPSNPSTIDISPQQFAISPCSCIGPKGKATQLTVGYGIQLFVYVVCAVLFLKTKSSTLLVCLYHKYK